MPSLVLSRTTYPPDLDLDVILGISPDTTTIDYDQADFDEQAYGLSYDGDTVLKSGGSKGGGDKGSPSAGTSNKSGDRTRFMMMQADADDNVDAPILDNTGVDNNQLSAENNVVLGGASGGTSGAVSGEVNDPDPDMDADGSENVSGRTTREAPSTNVIGTAKTSKGKGEKTSTEASSNEITAASSNEVTDKPQKSGSGDSKSNGATKKVTDKSNKSKYDREKASNEVTDKPNKANSMTTTSPPKAPKPSKTGSNTSKDPKTGNLTFSSCFENRQASTSQSDFCRFTNAVHEVCEAYFSNICSGSRGSNQQGSAESESYASEESVDSESMDYSIDSTDFDSLTASLESFGSSEMSDNEMREVLKIVKGLCSNVCSAAKKRNGQPTRSDSIADSLESGPSSLDKDDDNERESSEIGNNPSDAEDMSDERDTEDTSGVRNNERAGGRSSREKKQGNTQGGRGRNGRRKTNTGGRNTDYERENESESDSD